MASPLAPQSAGGYSSDSSNFAFDSSPVAIALTDLTGRIEHANSAFHQLFGLSPAIAGSHPDITNLCSGCSELSFLDALARDGRTRQVEITLRRPGGMPHRFLCNGTRVEGEEGLPKWLSLCFIDLGRVERDITRDDDATADSVLVEKLAGIGSWRMSVRNPQDVLRNTMRWSPALSGLFNVSPVDGEHGLQQYLNGVHPDDRGRVLTAMRATIASNIDYVIEFRRSGTTRMIRSRGALLRSREPGAPLVLVGIDQDVTQEYQRDQQQRRESLVLKATLDSCDCSVYSVDRQLCYVAFNRAFLDSLTPENRQEVAIGADALSIAGDPVRRKQVADNLRRALRGELRVEEGHAPGSAPISVRQEIVYSPMLGESREIIGVAVFSRELRDVPDRKAAPVRSWRGQDWLKPVSGAIALSSGRK